MKKLLIGIACVVLGLALPELELSYRFISFLSGALLGAGIVIIIIEAFRLITKSITKN
ncbi:hypothetical protein [Balneicella halophila]|uniref:hypothetical protein n=1 Tax=Balneicella halophila TaxID=1537566 RepID=UPI001403184B|nr:hypothetical protein [Balneicella halophila]